MDSPKLKLKNPQEQQLINLAVQFGQLAATEGKEKGWDVLQIVREAKRTCKEVMEGYPSDARRRFLENCGILEGISNIIKMPVLQDIAKNVLDIHVKIFDVLDEQQGNVQSKSGIQTELVSHPTSDQSRPPVDLGQGKQESQPETRWTPNTAWNRLERLADEFAKNSKNLITDIDAAILQNFGPDFFSVRNMPKVQEFFLERRKLHDLGYMLATDLLPLKIAPGWEKLEAMYSELPAGEITDASVTPILAKHFPSVTFAPNQITDFVHYFAQIRVDRIAGNAVFAILKEMMKRNGDHNADRGEGIDRSGHEREVGTGGSNDLFLYDLASKAHRKAKKALRKSRDSKKDEDADDKEKSKSKKKDPEQTPDLPPEYASTMRGGFQQYILLFCVPDQRATDPEKKEVARRLRKATADQGLDTDWVDAILAAIQKIALAGDRAEDLRRVSDEVKRADLSTESGCHQLARTIQIIAVTAPAKKDEPQPQPPQPIKVEGLSELVSLLKERAAADKEESARAREAAHAKESEKGKESGHGEKGHEEKDHAKKGHEENGHGKKGHEDDGGHGAHKAAPHVLLHEPVVDLEWNAMANAGYGNPGAILSYFGGGSKPKDDHAEAKHDDHAGDKKEVKKDEKHAA